MKTKLDTFDTFVSGTLLSHLYCFLCKTRRFVCLELVRLLMLIVKCYSFPLLSFGFKLFRENVVNWLYIYKPWIFSFVSGFKVSKRNVVCFYAFKWLMYLIFVICVPGYLRSSRGQTWGTLGSTLFLKKLQFFFNFFSTFFGSPYLRKYWMDCTEISVCGRH